MSTAVMNNDSHSEHESASPSTCKFGMIMFLASEAMLFGGLIGGYIVLRLSQAQWPPFPDSPALPLFLTGINTVFLVASSVTFHYAEVGINKGKSGLGLLMLTIGLGSLFLLIQCFEWWHLHREGLWFNKGGVYGSTFFVMTGFHGMHVLIGVLLIVWCFLRQLFTRCFTPTHHVALQNVALYWHFVDVVWIFLYTIVYLWR